MSDEESQASQSDALARQIQSLEAQYAGLSSAIGRGGGVRLTLFLLLAAFIAIFGFLYYRAVDRLINDPDQLIAEIEKQAPPTMDAIMREVQKLGGNVASPVADVFQAQMEQDLQRFLEALRNERDPLVENLQLALDEKVHTHYDKLLHEHQAILEEEFPDVAKDDGYAKMIGNFQIAFERLVKQHYGDEFRNEADQLAKTWESFPPADLPAEGEQELVEELKGQLVILLEHVVTRRAHPLDDAEDDRTK